MLKNEVTAFIHNTTEKFKVRRPFGYGVTWTIRVPVSGGNEKKIPSFSSGTRSGILQPTRLHHDIFARFLTVSTKSSFILCFFPYIFGVHSWPKKLFDTHVFVTHGKPALRIIWHECVSRAPKFPIIYIIATSQYPRLSVNFYGSLRLTTRFRNLKLHW